MLNMKDRALPYRAWINQPSTLQPLNKYNGMRCIAINDPKVRGTADIYFTDGDIISMRVDTLCLSDCN